MPDVNVTVETSPINVSVRTSPFGISVSQAGTQGPGLPTDSYLLRTETGYFYPASNPSGYTTGIDVSFLVPRSESGQFYASSNPSGFITGVDLSPYVQNNQTGSFITSSQTGQFYPNNNPSGYITGVNTGNFITSNQTGNFYPITNPSGFITGINTGDFVSKSSTGIFITSSQTGQFYAASNPNGYITGVNLSSYITTGQTGAFYPITNPSGYITTGQTGVFVATNQTGSFVTTSQTGSFVTSGQTGNFVTTSQTGAFYPITNPSGYITGVNLSAYITTGQTGIFYPSNNPSGYITGVDLSNYVTGSVVRPTETGNFITSGQTGNFIISSGLTTNYIPLATGSNGLINSVIYQSGSNVGIGTITPTTALSFPTGAKISWPGINQYISSDGDYSMNLSTRYGVFINNNTNQGAGLPQGCWSPLIKINQGTQGPQYCPNIAETTGSQASNPAAKYDIAINATNALWNYQGVKSRRAAGDIIFNGGQGGTSALVNEDGGDAGKIISYLKMGGTASGSGIIGTNGEFVIRKVSGSIVNDIFNVKYNGNVGIGTIPESYRLDILGDALNTPNVHFKNVNNYEWHFGGWTTADNFSITKTRVGDYLKLDNANKTITFNPVDDAGKTIFSAGNVGIGKTNPTVKLEVGGTTATDIIRTDNGLDFNPVIVPTDVTLALISGSGNVNTGSHYYYCSYYTAIGETELRVNGLRPNITTTTESGSVLVTLPISSDYRVIGRKLYRGTANTSYYAAIRLLATITNNTQSTFIDNVADASLTGTSYYYNENSTCKYITVNGGKSMFISTNNTVFGYGAGNNIGSTAQTSQNALFGHYAGRDITIGTRNTCIGDSAGYGVTAGGSNTLLGYSAGSAIGNGGNNVVIGQNTMLQVGGDGNTLVGTSVAQGSPYGGYIAYNTCLGRSAGFNLSGGAHNNTLIGYYAGYSNKIGATNICLGYYAGANLTSGWNNIIIGNQVEPPINGGNYQLNIANLIFASGSAFGTGTQVSTGSNVGIRTSSPLAGLDVKGDCKFGSASTGNYTHFEADGSMKMYGTATVFDDIRIEPTVRGAGVQVPVFEQYLDNGSGSRGVYLYSFIDQHTANLENEMFFTLQMPHGWASTDIHIHAHWTPATSGTGGNNKVKWGLEYSWANPGEIYGNTTMVYQNQTAVPSGQDTNLIAKKHYISEFSGIAPTTGQNHISSILMGRLFRNSSDNTNDTYTDKVGLLYIDCHVEMNTLGSHEEYTK